ncbi:MAG: hypothetical protein ABSA76_09255 [Bacteroidales bacterium]
MRKFILGHPLTGLLAGKILKKYLFIFTLGIFSLGSMANPKLASKQQIGMFLNSKTCVVLENANISYNVLIKDAVQNYWKSTEFEFIDQQEFEKRRFDSRYSFLVLLTGVYDKDPGGVSYNYLSLVLGDAANDIAKMPELCSIPLSYSSDFNNDYDYVVPAIVKFMQKHVKNLENNRFLISLKGLKYYNGSTGFKDKVLLFNKDVMARDADSPEKINTVYPYYIKLLTASEIQEELASNPSNALFHFHVGPTQNTGAGKCFNMIFDVEGNLYYYNCRKITNDNEDGFNLKDFYSIR